MAPENITPQKHGTIFGVFVQPTSGSLLQPQIVAVRGSTGKALPVTYGRPFRSGVSDEAVAFFKDSAAGPVTIGVTGAHGSTGSYQVETTLAGDVNGDGTVNFADLQAFAPSYMSQQGEPNYNPAADFNLNGVINLYDAKALLHNMAPLTPDLPLTARLTLAPQDQIHYSGPTVSGAATFKPRVTILGHTTPGSLVITDNKHLEAAGRHAGLQVHGPRVCDRRQRFLLDHDHEHSGTEQQRLPDPRPVRPPDDHRLPDLLDSLRDGSRSAALDGQPLSGLLQS